MLTLSDPMQAYDLTAPNPAWGVTFTLAVYVPNVDEVTATAQSRRAILREPPATFVSGYRFASIATRSDCDGQS